MLRVGPWLYTWDEAKRQAVSAKHGIEFPDVAAALSGPHVRDFDDAHSDDEDRWSALVEVKGRVVKAVFLESANRRRLITAFRASREEAILFYDMLFGDLK